MAVAIAIAGADRGSFRDGGVVEWWPPTGCSPDYFSPFACLRCACHRPTARRRDAIGRQPHSRRRRRAGSTYLFFFSIYQLSRFAGWWALASRAGLSLASPAPQHNSPFQLALPTFSPTLRSSHTPDAGAALALSVPSLPSLLSIASRHLSPIVRHLGQKPLAPQKPPPRPKC